MPGIRFKGDKIQGRTGLGIMVDIARALLGLMGDFGYAIGERR
jgi:hypothetical protein